MIAEASVQFRDEVNKKNTVGGDAPSTTTTSQREIYIWSTEREDFHTKNAG